MPFLVRTTLSVVCLCFALAIATGCGDGRSPAGPSGVTGAVIAGNVTSASGSISTARASAGSGAVRPAVSPFNGLTVRVVGTNRSAVVDANGSFQISDVPTGTVTLQFTGDAVNVTVSISNVTADQFIQIEIQVTGSSAQIVDETRSHKVSLCHAEGNGTYHMIDVSESSEPAHRDHGDAEVGEPVPGQPFKIFDSNCIPIGPSIDVEKFTNGEDADNPPGPEILVGSPVTWTYVVTNTGTVPLSAIVVIDNRPGVTVTCPQTSLAATVSMTCTAIGVAVLGQYSNIGTATGSFTFNGTSSTVSDTDASHYRGVTPEQEEEGPKVSLCHRTGAGFYVLISVTINAEPAHLAHGDGRPGQAVPGQAGRSFSSTCSVQ